MTANQPTSHASAQLEDSQCRESISETGAGADDEKAATGAEQADTVKKDVPPNGGYGWVCVACVFWINAHTWGINSVRSLVDIISISSADSFIVLRSFPRLLPCA